IVYSPGSDCKYPQRCTTGGLWVVSSYSVTADWGTSGKPQGSAGAAAPQVNTFSFQYADGRSDVRGRGWLGFAAVGSWDAQRFENTVTTYNNAETETGSGYLQAGLPVSIETTSAIGLDTE